MCIWCFAKAALNAICCKKPSARFTVKRFLYARSELSIANDCVNFSLHHLLLFWFCTIVTTSQICFSALIVKSYLFNFLIRQCLANWLRTCPWNYVFITYLLFGHLIQFTYWYISHIFFNPVDFHRSSDTTLDWDLPPYQPEQHLRRQPERRCYWIQIQHPYNVSIHWLLRAIQIANQYRPDQIWGTTLISSRTCSVPTFT